MLTLLLLDPPPHPPLTYAELCIPLQIQEDLRCSSVLLDPGPSKPRVSRTGERRRVTFVGIFNSGENKQIALELNVKESSDCCMGRREGRLLSGTAFSVALSGCMWEMQLCLKPARKDKWAVFVNVQLHPTVGRLVRHVGSPQGRTRIHHPAMHPENTY